MFLHLGVNFPILSQGITRHTATTIFTVKIGTLCSSETCRYPPTRIQSVIMQTTAIHTFTNMTSSKILVVMYYSSSSTLRSYHFFPFNQSKFQSRPPFDFFFVIIPKTIVLGSIICNHHQSLGYNGM